MGSENICTHTRLFKHTQTHMETKRGAHPTSASKVYNNPPPRCRMINRALPGSRYKDRSHAAAISKTLSAIFGFIERGEEWKWIKCCSKTWSRTFCLLPPINHCHTHSSWTFESDLQGNLYVAVLIMCTYITIVLPGGSEAEPFLQIMYDVLSYGFTYICKTWCPHGFELQTRQGATTFFLSIKWRKQNFKWPQRQIDSSSGSAFGSPWWAVVRLI